MSASRTIWRGSKTAMAILVGASTLLPTGAYAARHGGSGPYGAGYAKICYRMYQAKYCDNGSCGPRLSHAAVAKIHHCMHRHGTMT
jgi:hypothetical protein